MKFLLILLFPFALHAQSVSVSPTSFKAWGNIENMSEISISHKNIGIHYFYSHDTDQKYAFTFKGKRVVSRVKSNLAISYSALSLLEIIDVGAIFFYKNFPTDDMSRLNYFVGASVPIKRFKISYRHISNGFGIINNFNPGYDTITLTIAIN